MLKPLLLRRTTRSGFSLIELLVVMGIMVIVITSIAVYFGAIAGSARRSATATTLRKLDSLVGARFDELQSSFRDQEDKKLNRVEWINVVNHASDAYVTGTLMPSTPAGARQAALKLDRYRGTLPQRVDDLLGPDGSADTADDSPLLAAWKTANPTLSSPYYKTDRTLESSELLTLALTVGTSAGAGKEIVDSLKKLHVQDKDNNGLAELYDDWGNPIRFYNAPTRLVKPGGVDTVPSAVQFGLAQTLMPGIPAIPASAVDLTNTFNQDPLDPKGALRSLSSGATPSRYLSAATMEGLFHTADTYYRPILVSCGEDGLLGLGEPTASGSARLGVVLSAGDAADNLTSLQAVGAQ